MDLQQAGVGNMLDTIQQGTQGAQDFLESSERMRESGAFDVINQARESGEKIEGIFGEQFDTFRAGADKLEATAAEGKGITARAEERYTKAKGALEEGIGRGLEAYETGVQKAEGGISEGLDLLRGRARRTTVPGQDILEGKLAAKTQEGVRQIKELGGGQGLSAISELVQGEEESLRDLAIEGSRQRMVSETELADSLMRTAQTREGMYRGLGDAYTRAGSSMAGFESDVTGALSSAERADLANRLGVSQVGLDLLGEGYLGMAGAADTAAGRNIAARQYGTGLMGDIYSEQAQMGYAGAGRAAEAQRYGLSAQQAGYDQRAAMMAQNLGMTAEAQRYGIGVTGEYDQMLASQAMAATGMMGDVGQYGINLTGQQYANLTDTQRQNLERGMGTAQWGTQAQAQAQMGYADMVGAQTGQMGAAEQAAYGDYAAALQAQGGAGAQWGQMGAAGAGQAAQMAGDAYTQYYGNVAGAQQGLAGFYGQRAQDMANRELSATQYQAGLGMQGMGMAGTAGQYAADVGLSGARDLAGLQQGYYGGMTDLSLQQGMGMGDYYGRAGQQNINTALQAAQLRSTGITTNAALMGDYYQQQMEQDKLKYQTNQLDPWMMQNQYYQQRAAQTDPFMAGMGYQGDVASLTFAQQDRMAAAANNRYNAKMQLWSGIAGAIGNLGSNFMQAGQNYQPAYQNYGY
jgi:hypothetical protein